ncbi:hypothetical protein HW452_13725 [Halomonas aquamarina]|uniref:Uncharacterized protein n=1 Tax=Vreelandella aquamarina TaxID=77097 RepID=A0ACC5VWH0_9GAMM|nr:hypothetical protein [Halomonas aquamarina]MBZ5488585.1 hypothetical protein [Halomonas aquamarina]
MKPLLTALASSALLVGAPVASGVTFNTQEAETHGQWQSLILSLGREHHFRAVETQSYSDATLSLNATQGVCDLPWLEVRVTLEEQQASSRTVNLVPVRLRIDEQPVMDSMAEFITERGDDGFYVHFYLADMPALIHQMQEGQQLFLGFDQGERPPWYMTFGLEGADEAIARMQTLCEAA